MGRLAILFFVAYLVSMASALIDCLSVERPEEIRYLPRGVWVLIILVPFGAIAWFLGGRPERPVPATGPIPPAEPTERTRTVAPDDDPEFLASLHRLNADDEELLRRWEEDLRRREDELRKREPGEEPSDQ
jgi:hypothetical protein